MTTLVDYQYHNTEVKHTKDGKIVRKVNIHNGTGYKSVTRYRKGKRVSTVKQPVHEQHMDLILGGKFIPGLFSDCSSKTQTQTQKQDRKQKTRKNKRT